MRALPVFDPTAYQKRSYTCEGRTVHCRVWEGLVYCAHPTEAVQQLNLYVPEALYAPQGINGYTLRTAPIFVPNAMEGFLAGPPLTPQGEAGGHAGIVFRAIEHGYVAACPGVRGRPTSPKTHTVPPQALRFAPATGPGSAQDLQQKALAATAGEQRRALAATGYAPAMIADLKAAIRWLRANRSRLPGNTRRIVLSGVSAGGALAALAAASGNSPDYEPYLMAMGAAQEADDVFAANCYCPITDLEHADMAYEWMYEGHNNFSSIQTYDRLHGRAIRKGYAGMQTAAQQRIAKELKAMFPPYLNSLGLTGPGGRPLTLGPDGEGPFKQAVCRSVMHAAQRELDTHDSAERLAAYAMPGSAVEAQPWLQVQHGLVTGMHWDGFVASLTRMKPAPAFDSLALRSAENKLFGGSGKLARHFTAYGAAHSEVGGSRASEVRVQLLDPLRYIGKADTAIHWRIRHGLYDRDTSLAIPVILATRLRNCGYEVDFALPWGLPHCGNYDLDGLFAWVDALCAGAPQG